MQDQDGIIIVGAGGHAKVVLSNVIASGYKVVGFVDDNPKLWGTKIGNYPVLGEISLLTSYPHHAAVLGLGNNQLRKKYASLYKHVNWQSIVHPTAYVHESVIVRNGTVIFAGAVVQPDTMIGEHVIINTSASIDHDCHIGNYIHIAPGCHLAGRVTIGEGTFLGIGSCVIDGVSVGEWSTLGAGSVITQPIERNVYAKGVPAKVYKLAEQE